MRLEPHSALLRHVTQLRKLKGGAAQRLLAEIACLLPADFLVRKRLIQYHAIPGSEVVDGHIVSLTVTRILSAEVQVFLQNGTWWIAPPVGSIPLQVIGLDECHTKDALSTALRDVTWVRRLQIMDARSCCVPFAVEIGVVGCASRLWRISCYQRECKQLITGYEWPIRVQLILRQSGWRVIDFRAANRRETRRAHRRLSNCSALSFSLQ